MNIFVFVLCRESLKTWLFKSMATGVSPPPNCRIFYSLLSQFILKLSQVIVTNEKLHWMTLLSLKLLLPFNFFMLSYVERLPL